MEMLELKVQRDLGESLDPQEQKVKLVMLEK